MLLRYARRWVKNVRSTTVVICIENTSKSCLHLRPSRKIRVRGFTLVELLVVIAIVAILASLVLPAFVIAKLKAQGTYCLGNLKQMQVAWALYNQDFSDFLAP